MPDDITMEKKSSTRSSVQNCKGSSVDSKFKQDANSKFPRSTRRREGGYPRSEAARKPNLQKNKALNDKRPRPRGVVNFDRDGSEVVEGDLLDAGVAIKSGSKKVNLNHLLNFTFAKREFQFDSHLGGKYTIQGRAKFTKYNKEQFLQANCQFIVQEEGNYTIHTVDPDILVDWALVEQVLLPCYEVPSCPICLYPAVGAKITRCGHIYCWPCILHYLSLSDKSWHKCPICYESIHKNDLKSVISLAKLAPKIGETITLSLVRRERGSLFAIPVTKWKLCPTKPLCLNDDSETTCFQKLLVAGRDEINSIIDRENKELRLLLSDEKNDPEICFIELALEGLRERKDLFKNADKNANILPCEHEEELQANAICLSTDLEFPLEQVTLNEGERESEGEELGDLFVREIEDGNCNFNSVDRKNCFYFYQASDGQHIYMNSLNIRMLIEEYGSLENCPPTISAKIMDLESTTMTEALRKRLRYLQHLPLTCQFQMVELYFDTPIISATTLSLFKPEIDKRRRTRSKKAREERRRERHIELEENKKIGKFPSARYKLDSMQQFPTYKSCSTDEDPPLGRDASENNSPSPETVSGCTAEDNDHQASFAHMLRTGKHRPGTVVAWGKANEPSPQSSIGAISVVDSDEDAPAPEYSVSFGDAIQEAINGMALKLDEPHEKDKKGKRKKGKNTLLFTTSMNRSK